ALKYEPSHFESHYDLGNLYFDAGDLRPAQLHYEVAAELDAEFPNVHFNLGLVNALSEDFDAAIKSLTDYKELAPDSEHAKANELLANIRLSISKS
ncbi:MAG: tetratricopeptide repeat protein, partial [bacterium]|nr:tetratricopeptide repeat protein [bacterium]